MCPHCGAPRVAQRPAVVTAGLVLYILLALSEAAGVFLGVLTVIAVAHDIPGGVIVGAVVAAFSLIGLAVAVWGVFLVVRRRTNSRVAAVLVMILTVAMIVVNVIWLGADSFWFALGLVVPSVALVLLSQASAVAYLSNNRSSLRGGWASPPVYLVAVLFIAVMIGPVFYIIISGFRDNSQMTLAPEQWPDPWRLDAYIQILTQSKFWPQALNSLICAVLTTIGVVVLGVMASFVLARYNFRGRGAMYTLFAAGLMFPMTVAITPLYILILNLGLMGTLAGIIIPQIAFALPTTVIILVPFLRAIPMEIEEAATVDGCSRLGFFRRMVIPLSMPGVVTVGILAFIGSWNSYMLPLYVLNDDTQYTLPLGVAMFSTAHATDTAAVMGFLSLSMIPALIFFSIFQKRIVGGLTGAVKG